MSSPTKLTAKTAIGMHRASGNRSSTRPVVGNEQADAHL